MCNRKLTCSCQESLFEGLPCRHELSVYVKTTQGIDALNIHPRWTKDYFAASILFCENSEESKSFQNHQTSQITTLRSIENDVSQTIKVFINFFLKC